MVLVIDNYDSFVHNLARYIRELGFPAYVVRNDKISLQQIIDMSPSHIVISPGPCTPNEAGISLELIQKLGAHMPILGVCLGHQAIGQAFGGIVTRAKQPLHGKVSAITHDAIGIFNGLKNPLRVARYHSLIVSENNLPTCLKVTARSAQGEIMALEHDEYPIYGVQFHPESVLTEQGHLLLKNFLYTHFTSRCEILTVSLQEIDAFFIAETDLVCP